MPCAEWTPAAIDAVLAAGFPDVVVAFGTFPSEFPMVPGEDRLGGVFGVVLVGVKLGC